MAKDERELLNQFNAENRAILYRCRWSPADAEIVVPELIRLLGSLDRHVVDEALRALFCIGTPALPAASAVAAHLRTENPMTKRLALQTLGQIAHEVPELCVQPISALLGDPGCCRDGLRILAFIGAPARDAIGAVQALFPSNDAKVRRDVLVTATSIDPASPLVQTMLESALSDRSKIVRHTAEKLRTQFKIV